MIDSTGMVSIMAKGTAKGAINAIRVLDEVTATWFNFYPEGQAAECTIGAICRVDFGLFNDGNATGNVYVKVTDGSGYVLLDRSVNLPANGTFATQTLQFTMPAHDVSLNFELGHT